MKRSILGLLTLLGAVSLSYALFLPNKRAAKNKANIAFQKGFGLYNEHNYSASMDFFLEAISYYPKHFQARRMLGQALYFSGEPQEAVREWGYIFDEGGSDLPLRLHIDRLSKADNKTKQSGSFNFTALNLVASEMGYRYVFPVFIGSFPGGNLLLLAKDGTDNGTLFELDSNTKFIDSFRRISGKLELPIGAAHNEKEVWITDYERDVVHRINWSQREKNYPLISSLDEIGKQGSKELEFRGPTGICYSNEFFFVVDRGNHRIQKISANGRFNLEFSEKEFREKLDDPFGIACDREGKIYISETRKGSISVFDSFGNFERNIGEDSLKRPKHLSLNYDNTILNISDEEEGVFLLELSTSKIHQIKEYQISGGESKKLIRPHSSYLDRNDNLFVADYSGHKLIHLVPESHLFRNLEIWIEKVDVHQFPKVAIWVSVKDDGGRYLNDLTKASFMINESQFNIPYFGDDHLEQFDDQISVVVLVSKTKGMKNYSDSLQWVLSFVAKDLRKKDLIKISSYDGDYRHEIPWTNSYLKLKQAVRQIKKDISSLDSSPLVGKALYSSAASLLPKRGKKALVWVIDGELSEEGFKEIGLQKVENYCKVNHISLYIISFENPYLVDFQDKKLRLMRVAQATKGRYYRAYSSEIRDLNKDIHSQERNYYLLHYKSQVDEEWKDQYIDINVKVNFQGRIGVENSGYFVP